MSLPKRLAFSVATLVLFFGVLELVLAAAGLKPVLVEEDPYVGFSSQLRLYEPTGLRDELRTARNKLQLFNEQTFSRAKPSGVYRIFTLGGSTTYGRPFDDRTSFSGWLRTYLTALDDSKVWEVINAGGISYASYRIANLMGELVDYEPDLFIIYSGHNEFLERRTYGGLIEEPETLTRTRLLLQRSRVWTVFRNAADRRNRRAREKYQLTGEVEELLDQSVGLEYYFRDDPFKEQVLDHYRYNLLRMVRLARAAGARVILVTVPVNEKDFSPFKSEYDAGLGESDRQWHRELMAEVSESLAADEIDLAVEQAETCVDLDPRQAEGLYLYGRALLAANRLDDAQTAFAGAIEEDVCPLRALETIDRIIRETANRGDVPLVDFRALLRARQQDLTGHSILGDELFLDHAHPSVEANGILARALVLELAEERIVDLPPDWEERVLPAVDSEVTARVDDEAQTLAYKNLAKVLIWAGKKDLAQKYVELASASADSASSDWELSYNGGRLALEEGRSAEAIDHLRNAVRIEPAAAAAYDMLGAALGEQGRLAEAIEAGKRAVDLEPRAATYWSNLSALQTEAGQYEAALRTARRAVRLDPDAAEAHNTLAKIYFDTEKLGQALQSYERAISLRPKYLEAMVNRGLVLGQMDRLPEAARVFDEVIALDPGMVGAHLGKAKVHFAVGRSGPAITELETVVELDPHHVEAIELLARDLLAAGDRKSARQVLEQGLAENSNSSSLYQAWGRFLAQQGRFEEATLAMERAIELAPTDLAPRIDLGNLWMARSRQAEAIPVLEEAVGLHPENDQALHILASAYLVTGRIDSARPLLEKALRLNPRNPRAAIDLGLVYEREGHWADALERFRQALSVEPGSARAREGEARMRQRLESAP